MEWLLEGAASGGLNGGPGGRDASGMVVFCVVRVVFREMGPLHSSAVATIQCTFYRRLAAL